EVEVDDTVHEPLTEVAIERGLVAELVQEAAQVAEVVAHSVRRDRRVLPTGPRGVQPGHERGRAEPRLPQLPKLVLRGLVVVEEYGRRHAGAVERIHQPPGSFSRFLQRIAAELDEEEAAAAGEQRGDVAFEAL